MPKHKQKQFLQPKKQAKNHRSEEPETANEFLQAGVEFEEAGEKWRAGDAAKSLRFFSRAIETYEAGLLKFPDDFDLAYNKARLQYEIAQQPKLLTYVPAPVSELLHTALQSHRYAVGIDPYNADLLFNIAQVQTSLAETFSEEKETANEDRGQALKLLQEALEFFQRCLNVQEYQFNQVQESSSGDGQHSPEQTTEPKHDASAMDLDDGKSPETTADADEAWATIVEPVTVDSLVDTLIAQIETLTTICALESSQLDWPLAWVEEYFQTTLQPKLSALPISPSHSRESTLATAKFRIALSHAAFRSNRIDLPTYAREIQSAFEYLDLSQDPHTLCDKADAELSLATTVRQQQQQQQREVHEQQEQQSPLPIPHFSDSPTSFNKFLWTHTTTALTALSAAAKLPNAPSLPRIHLRRGDAEILRFSLGHAQGAALAYDLAVKSTDTLLANAALYYRMAGRQASAEGSGAKEDGEEAYVKGVIVGLLEGKTEEIDGLSQGTKQDVSDTIEEMGEEGLLAREAVEGVLEKLKA